MRICFDRRLLMLTTTVLTSFLFAGNALAGKVTNHSRVPKNAVLLSNVNSLTLHADKLTTSRRVKPIPQLECVGPEDVCKLYTVDVMRCTNEGADYDADNIQWSCKASLPEEFKLGSTDVICEGYASSEDPYVLKGSCGVEYRLLLTSKGLEKYRSNKYRWSDDIDTEYSSWAYDTKQYQRSGKLMTRVFTIIFLAVAFIIIRGMWRAWRSNPPRRGGGNRPYGGGGGGDDNDPPPPYDSAPFSRRKQNSSSSSSRASSSRSQAQDGSWRPGFWSGAAAGAAAGYTAAAMNRPRAQQPSQNRQPYFGQTQESASSSSSRSAPSYSTERHESTGFGSTRRR